MTTDTETFPTTTFESVEFTGCGAIKPNFKGELRFEIDDAPQALIQLQALHTKKGKLVFISDQGQIPAEGGGNGSGDWANMDLQLDDEREVEYGRFCIGGECGHFCVPKEGDLANQFVCYKDPDALMVIVQNETLCPLGETDEASGDAEEPVGETDADDSGTIPAEPETVPMAARGAGVVIVLYPGDDEPHVTQVGEHTQYAELVADYFTAQGLNAKEIKAKIGDYDVALEDTGEQRVLSGAINPDDYGKRLVVSAS